ncbi:MAG TPA: hypothetical protein VD813_00105 [Pseudonocardia sp.]|nr:hypothetical protein [Pseudonocardia sp.]
MRPPVPPPARREPPPDEEEGRPEPSRHTWRRVTRSRRGAAGLGILAAALLLWPFAGWSAIPWLAGLAALVLLRLLRLDGLLRGWAPHLAGLVVVGGLAIETGPWAWALAASIGVLLAGLTQLPWWRLAAVGAAMCVVSGIGYAVSTYRDAQQIAGEQAQTSLQNQGQLGAVRPNAVLPVLLNAIAREDVDAICTNLIAEPARAAFAASTGAQDCAAAVDILAAQVRDPNEYPDARAQSTSGGEIISVDACALSWRSAEPAGPQLGRLTVARTTGTGYFITEFRPC